jgi:hypothetical protein
MTTTSGKPKRAKANPLTPKSRILNVPQRKGVEYDRAVSDLMTEGIAPNGSVMVRYLGTDHGELSLTDMVASLKAQGEAVNAGDLAAAERMLSAQAAALNAIFGELARRAALNLGEYLGAAETYMRLALKAQSQSRATIETLAAIKNPPTVYARQVNVANGLQQVNNGPAPNSTPASTHAGETNFQPNELLEDHTHGRTQLDTRAAATAGRAHQDVEAVGALNRPDDRGR